jgi:hypothetical protein
MAEDIPNKYAKQLFIVIAVAAALYCGAVIFFVL